MTDGTGATDSTGVWVYAITEDRPGAEQIRLTGLADAPVRAAPAGDLAALVSDVDLAEYGEAALRHNLEDLDWLAAVARTHHRVIASAAARFPLLPARLATVYRGDAAMSAALSARNPELRMALRRVGGRTELGVKAYALDRPAPPGHDAAAPENQDAQGAGVAYLERRRAQLAAARDTSDVATASAQALHAALSARAALTRLHPPQSPQLSGVHEPMLLNAAYLVDTDRAAEFAEVVALIASAHPQLRVELTGPWPPYSFVTPDDAPLAEGDR